ncbi:26S proteasome regulatory subunit [Gaertneriomyces sp. JEL0708]|nr:26S proteasome regulatory subunit [Gaertneriomyces sp. JEL0708]
MDVDRDVTVWLRESRDKASPALKEFFTRFEDLYDRKLYHQLTVTLEEFVNLKNENVEQWFLPLYEHFVSDWEGKMNQLSLVQFVVRASKVLGDPAKSIEFLTPLHTRLSNPPKSKKDDNPTHTTETLSAHVLLSTAIASYTLHSNTEAAKDLLDKCESIMDKELTYVVPIVSAAYYRVASDYYKAKLMYPEYYRTALLFLSSVNLDELREVEKQERAYELAIAAVLGEGVYNFGELLQHPILSSLESTPYSFLPSLLSSFNTGAISQFSALSTSPAFLKTPLLVSNISFLHQKICLMALVEMVFHKTKDERGRITFEEISEKCQVGRDDVEHLVMRGMRVGLVKGNIDEVEGVVNITWVQPRILSSEQIKTIRDRLAGWSDAVKSRVLDLETVEIGEGFNP